jgi:hypothetical protein
MSLNKSSTQVNPVKLTPNEQPQSTDDRDDLRRGKLLMGIFIIMLILLGSVYVWAHYKRPNGLFASTSTGLSVVADARTALEATGDDILDPALVAELTQLSNRLRLLAGQLGVGSDFTNVLDQITTELSGAEAHQAVLLPLFNQLDNIIRVGSGSYFWSGSLDRWIELLFWTVVGTLVFLLSELKKYSSQPYQKYREFKKYTSWYIINFFRGPFIAMIILIALLSLSFDAIGISVDLKSAPIEVLIVAAAILGYYSRVADKELDIITEKLFSAAWQKTQFNEPSSQHPTSKNQ